jgi:hypothetical protein
MTHDTEHLEPNLAALVSKLKRRGWFWENPNQDCRDRLSPPRILVERVPIDDRAGVLYRLALLVMIIEFHDGDVGKLTHDTFRAMKFAALGHLIGWLAAEYDLDLDDTDSGVAKLHDELEAWGVRRVEPSKARWYESLATEHRLYDDECFEPAMTIGLLDVWSRAVSVELDDRALKRARDAHRRAKGECRDTRGNEEQLPPGIDYDALIAYHDLLLDEGPNSYIRGGRILLSARNVRDQLNHVFGSGVTAGPTKFRGVPPAELSADTEPAPQAAQDSEAREALEILGLIDEERQIDEDALLERIDEIRGSENAARVAARLGSTLGAKRPRLAQLFGVTEEQIRWAERRLSGGSTDT